MEMYRMKRRLTCLLIITTLLLVSCGKKDLTEKTNITSSPTATEIIEDIEATSETGPELEYIDISADVTPENVKIVKTSDNLIGKLEITTDRPKRNFLINDTYNFIYFTFTAYKSSSTPIILCVNGEAVLLDKMPIVEAGHTYEFELYREIINYMPISAYIEADGAKSNIATIYAYDRMNSEIANNVHKEITGLENLTEDLIIDGYISDRNVEEALSRVENAANDIKDNGDIIEVVKSDDHVYIRFNSGVEYIYAPPKKGVKASGDKISIYTYQPFADPHCESPLPSEEMDSLAEYINDSFDEIEFSHDINDSTIDIDYIIDNFSRNQIIIWDGHGGYDERIGAYLETGDTWQASSGFDVGKGWLITTGGRYAVGADFFDIWLEKGDLDNSFIVLSACHSGQEDESHSLMKTLYDKGASVVIGFSDSVKTDYANLLIDYTMKKMCTVDGETSEYYTALDAIRCAAGAYGADDSIKFDGDGAVPTYFGDYDYRFSNAIKKLSTNTIPDGEYAAVLGSFGNSTADTYEIYGHTYGNLISARIDKKTHTLIIEAGFTKIDDAYKTIPYDCYELPLAPNFSLLAAGTEDEPDPYYVEDFNISFYEQPLPEGYGLTITIEGGYITEIYCWGS